MKINKIAICLMSLLLMIPVISNTADKYALTRPERLARLATWIDEFASVVALEKVQQLIKEQENPDLNSEYCKDQLKFIISDKIIVDTWIAHLQQFHYNLPEHQNERYELNKLIDEKIKKKRGLTFCWSKIGKWSAMSTVALYFSGFIYVNFLKKNTNE